jgi:hypothetical protein
MLLHNLLDLLSKLIRRRPRQETGQVVMRMNLWFRVAHWGIMASFPTLVVTGFALKFPDSWWAKPLLMWESNAGVRGGLHRTAAVVMIAATLFHFVHLALKKRDRSIIPALLPTIKDATDMLQVLQPWADETGAAVREVQLRGKNGILGVSLGHHGDGAFRIFAVVQQFYVAPFSEVDH